MDNETRSLLFETISSDKWKYNGASLMQLLLRYQPRFLELHEEWVDILLNLEKNIKGHHGISCLTCLLQS